jgi:hypothetical protein
MFLDEDTKLVIKWLESPEGEDWSRHAHNTTGPATWLMSVKDDHWLGGFPVAILWLVQPDGYRVADDADF